jgi:hypothetical protein
MGEPAAEGGGGMYGVNQGFVEDTTKEAAMDTLLTFFSLNNGQPQPNFLTAWGYSQTQSDPKIPSTIQSEVTIAPGIGAQFPLTTFKFTTTLNETEGDFPVYHNFSEGEGIIERDETGKQLFLLPNNTPGVVIRLYGRTPENPPVWSIDIDNGYFSVGTAAGSKRVTLAIKLLLSDDSIVTVKKSVESGAQAYHYTKKKPQRPIVLRENPLFPPSKPLRQIG